MTERELQNKPRTLREFYKEGYRRVCLNCRTVFTPETVRIESCDDGHSGGFMEICFCGCDLIGYMVEKDGVLYVSPSTEISQMSFSVKD